MQVTPQLTRTDGSSNQKDDKQGTNRSKVKCIAGTNTRSFVSRPFEEEEEEEESTMRNQ